MQKVFYFTAAIQDTVPKPVLKELVTLQISDWYDLGLQLDIPENDLDIIKKDNPLDFRGARRTMFQTWLRRCTEANYQKLINALCIVGDEKVAASLCGKYGKHFHHFICKHLLGNICLDILMKLDVILYVVKFQKWA